jgi:hypothetical protein
MVVVVPVVVPMVTPVIVCISRTGYGIYHQNRGDNATNDNRGYR